MGFRKVCLAIAAALAVTVQISSGPAQATTGSTTTSATLSTVPGVPTSLHATALDEGVTLSWTPPSEGGSPITGYVMIPVIGTHVQNPLLVIGNTSSYTMWGLTNGISYTFTLATLNSTGIGQASAASAPVIPSGIPTAPTSVAATASTSGAMVWWEAPSAVASPVMGYMVTPYLGGIALPGVSFPSTATAGAITGLVEGQTYTFTVAAINAIGVGQASGPSASLTIAAPALTFDDEFTGPAGADPNYGMAKPYWNLDPCWKTGCSDSPTEYSSNNAYLDGKGDLVLQADQGATGMCGAEACQYTSAGLTMLDWANGGRPTWSQEYGTFSARIEMPLGQGLWPAFWLLGSNAASVGWPASGEIDAVEAHGQDPQSASGHAIGSADGTSESLQYGANYQLPNGGNISGWHTYSVTWSPYGIVWQIDGTTMLTMSAARAGPSWARSLQHPFSILLDLTVGGRTVGMPDASTVFPAKMLINSVQAWSS